MASTRASNAKGTPMQAPDEQKPIRNRGRFVPGVSGNPAGRPRSESAQVRARLQSRAEDVAEIVLAKALEGDLFAAKMILDRCSPPLKPRAEPVQIDLPTGAGIVAQAQAVLAAAASGQLPVDQATQLIGAVADLGQIIEVEELQRELTELRQLVEESRR